MCLKYNVNTSDSIKSYTGTSEKLKYFRKNSQNKLLSYRYMHFSLKIISIMSFLAWGHIKKVEKRESVCVRESLREITLVATADTAAVLIVVITSPSIICNSRNIKTI